MKIKIIIDNKEILAELNNSITAKKIYEILPIESNYNTWGDEIYFEILLHLDYENTKEVVEKGDLGYWPEGDCFCIFYGKTPMSRGEEIRPASKVNVFGKVIGDVNIFKNIKGNKIKIEKA